MAETYCGKNCAECALMEAQSCPGCQAGPGRRYYGNCELAKCCREKGHETCETCGFKETCKTLQDRDRQPEIRRRKAEAQQKEQEKKREEERKRKERMANRAHVLGKWLWILFWLFVPALIASIMGNEKISETAPDIYLTGQILSVVCSIAYGLVLLKASSEEDRYRTAGICLLVSAAAGFLTVILSRGGTASPGLLLIALPASIVSLVGEYQEYYGHSAVLGDVDRELSAKWLSLWKWNIGCMVGVIGGGILGQVAPGLGLFIVLCSSIGVIIVHVLKLRYLYRTAKLFRDQMIGE